MRTYEINWSFCVPADVKVGLWDFRKLTTLCQELVLRTGRLTKPGNDLTLTMSANQAVVVEVAHLMWREAYMVV